MIESKNRKGKKDAMEEERNDVNFYGSIYLC